MSVTVAWFPIALVLALLLFVSVVACVVGLLGGAIRMAGHCSRPKDSEDDRIMQEIHNGLTRMEERIDALETIMLEREETRSER